MAKSFSFYCSLLCLVLSIARPSYAINGAPEAPADAAPFAVALYRSDGNFQRCGGVLISPYSVLTAASCIQNQSHKTLVAHVGSNNRTTKAGMRNLTSIIQHPDYDIDTRDSDLAILTLGEPADDVKFALIDDFDSSIGANLTVYGWGFTNYSIGIFPDNIHELVTVGITREKCRSEWKGVHTISDRMVCDQPPTEKAAWLGDKGGPLVNNADGTVVGLVSFTIYDTDLRKAMPDVYTDLGYFRPWIMENAVF
ncbi:S1 family serine peptidase [Aspergillus clavatus NRRL 1]|uniref:Trypsin-like serine protease, putative n=1 Tax=Aspergillus clavatus (strain ATCC 1007 / CBS 513.65 / DSM 816 / NCTC 3887 / NRRL 1 / QM 1276 / 107) TaxID=344612 RepID=A1CN69_ASPCL|nr:trypsin-like serine protease, putative [Aspergillus clavatus NRRL 1]EAW07090.1 trypsin-like serine protease, putative [Aspergillus clavatus NRRL 1]